MNPVALALTATGFTFLMNVAGSACVFLFNGKIRPVFHRSFLGFAAGVMMAACAWSMLVPSIDMAREQGGTGYIEATGGFLLGGIFLLIADKKFTALYLKHKGKQHAQSSTLRRTSLLFGAITLHNLPEGMAVGLACVLAAKSASAAELAAAAALALGIGLQNFPEGAAVSLPLCQEGFSKKRSFTYGMLSAIVEPIGAVVAVLLATVIAPTLPWLLSFSAGAMIYAVAAELIPQSYSEDSHSGIIGLIIGFAFMMTLDVALS